MFLPAQLSPIHKSIELSPICTTENKQNSASFDSKAEVLCLPPTSACALSQLLWGSRLWCCFSRHLRNTAAPETRSNKGEGGRGEGGKRCGSEIMTPEVSEEFPSSFNSEEVPQPSKFGSPSFPMSAFAALCHISPLGQIVLSSTQLLLLQPGTKVVPVGQNCPLVHAKDLGPLDGKLEHTDICWQSWVTATFGIGFSN